MWIERIKSLFLYRKGYQHFGRHGIQAESEENKANWYGKSDRVEEEYVGDGIHRDDNLDATNDAHKQDPQHPTSESEERH